MPNKYKHIKLPDSMLSAERRHTYVQPPFHQPLDPIDIQLHKSNLIKRSSQLKESLKRNNQSRKISEDKESAEIEIVFRGYPDNKFLKKYGVNVYEKDDDRVIGRVSNKKLSGQQLSDFEQLNEDIQSYGTRNELKSYFEKIDDISPLELEDIIEDELKKEYEDNPDKEVMIDVSFADDHILSAKKLDLIKNEYANKFISSVNTNLVHFCRIVADFKTIQETVSNYGGISFVETSPDFEMRVSATDTKIRNPQVIPISATTNPVIIFDTLVNDQHLILKGAVVERIGATSGDQKHGTSVASLVVCGMGLHPDVTTEQKNTVIAINAFDGHKLEEIIETNIKTLATKYPILIANLSINDYGKGYTRKRVSNLTVLLDELAHDHNCIFFISVGNINEVLGDASVAHSVAEYCQKNGYPNYFKQPFAYLLPPADSINNVSVGSVAYQQSPNSVVNIKNPVPFSRINFPNNDFIKPDFVHYDGNLRLQGNRFIPEENGVTCAGENNDSLTNRSGTSFATPLVTHQAGVLHNSYQNYNANTIRALLTHFADPIEANQISDQDIKKRLVGFGMPNLEKTLYSLASSVSVVVEDKIGVNKTKRVKLPIPNSLNGDSRKRLRILLTLAYNPKVNPKDVSKYNPINVSVKLVRPDDRDMNSSTTRDRLTEAYSKSNVKRYQPIELSTRKHMGSMWELEVTCESRSEEVPSDYIQNYSLIATVEDMKQDETIDLYTEIVQMIEIETHVGIPVEVMN